MAKRLRKLKINEVSSVDRGAGDGTRVVLLKRDDALDDGDLAQQMLSASEALKISIASLYADDTLDVQARDLALKETFEQYRQHVGQLIADAVDEEDAEEVTAKTFDAIRAEREAEEDTDTDPDDADKSFGDARRYRRRQRRKKPDTTPAADTKKGQSMDILQIAKRVNAGEAPGAVTRADFYNAIVEIGEEIRKTSVAAGKPISTEIAFTRAMMTPEGTCLYAASKRAQGPATDLAGPRVTQPRELASAPSPALQKLTALAEDLRKVEPTLTRDGAFAKIYTDPRFAELANAERNERRARAIAGRRCSPHPPWRR